ncbi:MAG: adenine deaminase [Candidatus Bathyarchaeia archaeon]
MVDLDLINVGLGKKKASLAIKNGRLVNVLTDEIHAADIAVYGKRIAAIGKIDQCIGEATKIIDAKGKYITPGLIDGHVHPESSLLSITKFAMVVIPRGTTSIMTSMDEIGTVAGLAGIREMLNEAKRTPLKVFHCVPSRIPYIPWADTTGGEVGIKEVREALKCEESIGIWETTIQLVLGLDKNVLKAIDEALKRKTTVHGHCPFATGSMLAAYLSVGIRSDHEAFNVDEALEKVRNGLKVMIREGSVAKQISDLIKIVTKHGVNSRNVMLITDDVDAEDLVKLGHMDHLVRRAIEEGVDPVKAIEMCSYNTAEAYRVDHLVGCIAPGRYADILLVDDLKSFRPQLVIANGEVVASDGKMLKAIEPPKRSRRLLKTFHLKKPIKANDLVVKTDPKAKKVKAISMQVPPDIPIRFKREVMLEVENGIVKPDVENDVLHISVVERHKRTGNKSTAFISGFNLKSGAIASSQAHDSHNIVCIGTNGEDMAYAINHIASINGGQVVVKDKKVVYELPLPICGLVTDLDAEKLSEEEEKLNKAVHDLGCKIARPFMFLVFISLAAIPEYAITDKGFVDVINNKFINPIIEIIK